MNGRYFPASQLLGFDTLAIFVSIMIGVVLLIATAFFRGIGNEVATRFIKLVETYFSSSDSDLADQDNTDELTDWDALPKARQKVLKNIETSMKKDSFTLQELQLALSDMHESNVPYDPSTLLINDDMLIKLVEDRYLTLEDSSKQLYLIDVENVGKNGTKSRYYQTQVRGLTRSVLEREGIDPDSMQVSIGRIELKFAIE
jgi:hypothetical protein